MLDMIKDWIYQNLYNLITTIIGSTSLFGYITERKRRKIEQRKESIDSLKTMQEAYDVFTEDSLKRYQEMVQEVSRLKEELLKLTNQLELEMKRYSSLQTKYFKLLRDHNIKDNNNNSED